ncbi:hypothetical protein M9Y10_011242 [Tritrichomonas musculus]|uniref:HMG box domain-containing protein n=1 Tax=Tritrichomonas musculus TaxID=1915356 RepID=A0ABR2IK10_9EUKA
MSIDEKCGLSSPTDREFFEKSMIYITSVFFDAHPETPIDDISKLAQSHLDLFKSIYFALNKSNDANDSEDTADELSASSELPSPIIKISDSTNISSNQKNLIKNKEIKSRPANPKRSPSKFSKDSFEFKRFVKYYSQKLRDKNIPPIERNAKINDKWNSMNTEKVLSYLKKHDKQGEQI